MSEPNEETVKGLIREALAPFIPADSVISFNGTYNRRSHCFAFVLLNEPDTPQCWELVDEGRIDEEDLIAAFCRLAEKLRALQPQAVSGLRSLDIPRMCMREEEQGERNG